jgi:hypothetical protein
MEHLWDAGIQSMQGYLFGCPSPEVSGTEMDLSRLARAIRPQPDGAGYDEARNPEWQLALASMGFD